MNWIFDNVQLVIVIASAFAYWLNQRRQGAEEKPPPESTLENDREHYEELRRRKKIQDDIRRKIAERRGEASPPVQSSQRQTQGDRPSPQSPQPVEPAAPEIPPFLRELMGIPEAEPERAAPPPMPEVAPVSDRQSRMEAELRELEVKRKEAEAMAAKVRSSAKAKKLRAATRAGSDNMSDREWLATLRNSKSARRAVVLREILGKPIALK
jgi:hypothetical protein